MRWLESQGKHDKVINALKKIAAVNKKPFPDLPTNTQVQVILFKTKLKFYTCLSVFAARLGKLMIFFN